MGNKVLSVYKICYPDLNVTQTKNLISHEDYLNDIKTKQAEITRLEAITPKSKTISRKISDIKKELVDNYGAEYFTDNSPIWESQFNNGMMVLPHYQGGSINVKLLKI